MGAKSTVTAFADDTTRIAYAARVAERIAEAMRDDPQIATDMLLRGRIGLAQMNDAQLVATGRDAWGVLPRPDELRAVMH